MRRRIVWINASNSIMAQLNAASSGDTWKVLETRIPNAKHREIGRNGVFASTHIPLYRPVSPGQR